MGRQTVLRSRLLIIAPAIPITGLIWAWNSRPDAYTSLRRANWCQKLNKLLDQPRTFHQVSSLKISLDWALSSGINSSLQFAVLLKPTFVGLQCFLGNKHTASATVMKFTYIKKSNGPNADPFGTLDVTGMERLEVPDNDTDIVRLTRELLIHEITIRSKPSKCRLSRRRRCDTTSKVFEKSR